MTPERFIYIYIYVYVIKFQKKPKNVHETKGRKNDERKRIRHSADSDH